MQKIGLFLTAVSVLLLSSSVLAQEQPGEIAQFFRVKPKPGMAQQLEEGSKQHVGWHRQQNDTWTWHLWQYETGDLYGQYVAVTPAHRWEDFDSKAEFRERDTADVVAKIGPYADSITSWFSRLHQDISYLPEGGVFNPKSFPLVLVVAFQVHQSKVSDFLYSARKFHAALQKANWPNYYFWSQLVAGGEGPLFNLVLPQKNWAGLTPPEKPFPVVLEEVLGRQEAESLIETFDGTIRSSRSDILRYRPDLSYVPSGQ